jgi:hypothetical protein
VNTHPDEGGAAFPLSRGDDGGWFQSGMSLRDWFAGQALAGLLAAGAQDFETGMMIAREAYIAADAMLAVRSQPKKED